MNYLPTISLDTRRLRILRRLIDCIGKVKAGDSIVLESGRSSYEFKNTVNLVNLSFIDMTEMQDEEFPAVFIIPEDATNFDHDSDGWTANAIWPISIYLNVKGDTSETARNQPILEMMESLFQDVAVAVLSDFNLGHAPDTILSVTALVPNPFTDPSFGQAVVQVEVRYTHNFFE